MDTITARDNRSVAVWLYIGAGMLIIQVLLGGITRLTGSGLSITEWQPILGAFPPMSEEAWEQAFARYREIGQFHYINSHFTLSDFKAIYFWEWLHRDWARLMGLVFIFPFIWFLIKKKISRGMVHPMIILFLLGALQGIIGWVMVRSGLNTESLYVNHVRLAIHFIAAMVLLCYLLWFALKISVPASAIQSAPALKKLNLLLIVLLFIQLTYGAFMAGSHAALAAPTWPDINGAWLPDSVIRAGEFGRDLTHNLISIQFIHRGLAYLITILLFIWSFMTFKLKEGCLLHKIRYVPLLLVIVQVFLGVTALLRVLSPNVILLNILHQFIGMLLLMMMFFTLFLVKQEK